MTAAELLPSELGSFRKKPASVSEQTNGPVWQEFGFASSDAGRYGATTITALKFKDTTGALAAWEWVRSANATPCTLASFCAQDAGRSYLFDGSNYVVLVDGGKPSTLLKLDQLWKTLPGVHESSLPALLTFLPRTDLIPNSSRYLLGPASLNAFAPELTPTNPGFAEGAEAQFASYKLKGETVRLGLFYYPTPEMARLHVIPLKLVPGAQAKRSGVLVAIVLTPATEQQANTLLSRVQYTARITWNEVPPPSPIRPLYLLLRNILFLSAALSALALMAGLIYAGMRVYRRRYGQLNSDEAMTTLNLNGD